MEPVRSPPPLPRALDLLGSCGFLLTLSSVGNSNDAFACFCVIFWLPVPGDRAWLPWLPPAWRWNGDCEGLCALFGTRSWRVDGRHVVLFFSLGFLAGLYRPLACPFLLLLNKPAFYHRATTSTAWRTFCWRVRFGTGSLCLNTR